MDELTKIFLYFIIYAFFGYIAEVVYVAICTKKITNRGYLYGPVVPIYGFGALLIIVSTNWAYDLHQWYSPILVFVIGFLVTSTLEYLTSYVMELIYHMRWWDYSDKFCNINGRVCLRNSTLFGLCTLFVMYLSQPYIANNTVEFIYGLGDVWFYIISGLLFIVIITDFVFSTIKHVDIAKTIRRLDELAREARLELKEKATEKANEFKEKTTEFKNEIKENNAKLKAFIEENNAMHKLHKIHVHYPSMRIKDKKNKKRITMHEFIERFKNKEDKNS